MQNLSSHNPYPLSLFAFDTHVLPSMGYKAHFEFQPSILFSVVTAYFLKPPNNQEVVTFEYLPE